MIKRSAFLLCASIFALAGCGGGGSGPLGSSCSPTTYSMNFPADAGFSASGTISAASGCFTSATVNTYTSLAPIGAPFTSTNPTAVVVLYLGVTFTSTEYATGLPSLNITLPAGVATSNRQFYIAANSSGTAFGWIPALEGPDTASGGTVSFGSGGGNTTFDANVEEVLALYSVAT
ncbi:MAG: hypothetical protein WBD74_13130 [Candidatus Aquilonibacter sp.]